MVITKTENKIAPIPSKSFAYCITPSDKRTSVMPTMIGLISE
jgi:hypothetical protein